MDVHGPDQGLPSLIVLVVEDNDVNCLYMQHLLRRQGHTAVAATTGREALDTVSRQPLDLILMDVQLPDMDGLSVTRAIRQGSCGQANPPDIPILALTAFAMHDDRERCLAAGMTDYLSKPIHVPELLAAMARSVAHFERKETAAAAGPENVCPPIDLTDLLNKGRQAFVIEMLTLFLQLAAPKGRDLQAALGRGDIPAAMKLAHDLIGMAGPLRAVRLHQAMQALQEACKSGDLTTCRSRHLQAGQELENVLAAVRAHPCLVDPAP